MPIEPRNLGHEVENGIRTARSTLPVATTSCTVMQGCEEFEAWVFRRGLGVDGQPGL